MNHTADLLSKVDIDREPDIRELVQEFDQDALLAALQAMLGANSLALPLPPWRKCCGCWGHNKGNCNHSVVAQSLERI